MGGSIDLIECKKTVCGKGNGEAYVPTYSIYLSHMAIALTQWQKPEAVATVQEKVKNLQ